MEVVDILKPKATEFFLLFSNGWTTIGNPCCCQDNINKQSYLMIMGAER